MTTPARMQIESPLIIAEIGLNHNGDLELARRQVAAAAQSGADVAKFQAFTPEDLVHPENKEAAGLFDIFRQTALDEEQLAAVAATCRDEGIDFAASPFAPRWVDLLVELNSRFLKIASGDVVNPLLLKACARAALKNENLPVLVSSGAADQHEVDRMVDFMRADGVDPVLLYCVSLYPTPVESLDLGRIHFWRDRYRLEMGFSDHTDGSWAAPLAAACGARVIEKHFTYDKSLPGPDQAISADAATFKEMAMACRRAWQVCQNNLPQPSQAEIDGRLWGRRGMYNADGSDYQPADKAGADDWLKAEAEGRLHYVRPYNRLELFDYIKED